MEAEYITCSAAMLEVARLKRFMEDLEINISNSSLVIIYCDSQAVIFFSQGCQMLQQVKTH